MAEHIWYCKVGGEIDDESWEPGGTYTPDDHTLREPVERAYQERFGVEPEFCFSGWGAELTESERAVVENRLPVTGLIPEPDVAKMIEAALLGTEARRGIWTDRDYLVHALALLTDSERAREAALARPKAINDGNLRPRDVKRGYAWWRQYEELADKLISGERGADDVDRSLVADDVLDLVNGLRDLEAKVYGRTHQDPSVVERGER